MPNETLMTFFQKRYFYIKRSYFPELFTNKNKIEVELDLSNYALNSDLKDGCKNR